MSSRKKIIFPAPDAFVFLSSQNRRCGAAPPATHILIEKAVACRALRHRPAAETTLPLPRPHRISPPPRRLCHCPALIVFHRRRSDSAAAPPSSYFTAAGETYSISLRSYEVTKIMLACGGTYVLLSPVTAWRTRSGKTRFRCMPTPDRDDRPPTSYEKARPPLLAADKKERIKAGRHGRPRRAETGRTKAGRHECPRRAEAGRAKTGRHGRPRQEETGRSLRL